MFSKLLSSCDETDSANCTIPLSFVVCSLLVFPDVLSITFSFREERLTVCSVPSKNRQSDTSVVSAHPVDPPFHCRYPQWFEPTDCVKDRDSAEARRTGHVETGVLLLAESPSMSENGQGNSVQKRFNGDGNSGTPEYKVWKRWARAALVVKKVGGMRHEALGP